MWFVREKLPVCLLFNKIYLFNLYLALLLILHLSLAQNCPTYIPGIHKYFFKGELADSLSTVLIDSLHSLNTSVHCPVQTILFSQ